MLLFYCAISYGKESNSNATRSGAMWCSCLFQPLGVTARVTGRVAAALNPTRRSPHCAPFAAAGSLVACRPPPRRRAVKAPERSPPTARAGEIAVVITTRGGRRQCGDNDPGEAIVARGGDDALPLLSSRHDGGARPRPRRRRVPTKLAVVVALTFFEAPTTPQLAPTAAVLTNNERMCDDSPASRRRG